MHTTNTSNTDDILSTCSHIFECMHAEDSHVSPYSNETMNAWHCVALVFRVLRICVIDIERLRASRGRNPIDDLH
jgi:hypothetical protein